MKNYLTFACLILTLTMKLNESCELVKYFYYKRLKNH